MGKPEGDSRQSLLVKVVTGILINIPLTVAGLLLKWRNSPAGKNVRAFVQKSFGRMKEFSPWRIVCLIAGTVILIAGLAVLAWVFYRAGNVPEVRKPLSVRWIVLKGALYYLFYLAALMPFFLPVAYFASAEKERFLKDAGKKREPELLVMRRNRLSSDKSRSYLGESLSGGEAVYLTCEQRSMHAEVVGSTGTGKSESVLLPLLAHDIRNGRGAIVIDGKGDRELLDRIHSIVVRADRLEDFYFFSLAKPDKCNSYNPLLRGNATELKDKIIGSMIWNEEFYRKMAEQAMLTLLKALKERPCEKGSDKPPTILFSEVYRCLTDFKALQELANATVDPETKGDLGKMLGRFDQNHKFLSGLIADLYLTSRSEFSKLVDTPTPEIDLLKIYKGNKIVYFQLNLQGYGETAKRMGRMILQDIRTVSGYIQSDMLTSERHFFPVFVDDASSFLDINFIDFLNKARAAGFGIMLLHQSLGDLVVRRDPSFQQQVIENTNIKIILRQDDPDSVEKLTKIGGTKKTLISTYQTEQKFTGKDFTGVGSIREGQEFRIEPDLIRGLKRGEAVVILKSPELYTGHVKLDFFGHPSYVGDFRAQHPLVETAAKKEEPPAALPAAKPEENTSHAVVPVSGGTETPPATKEKETRKDPTGWIKTMQQEKTGVKLP
ncbi:MAG: TraM recognition domain-containing protein [Candidatus Omnitrophota bacterium]